MNFYLKDSKYLDNAKNENFIQKKGELSLSIFTFTFFFTFRIKYKTLKKCFQGIPLGVRAKPYS